MCMHLTNYAVNKKNPNFIYNTKEDEDGIGHKRSFTAVLKVNYYLLYIYIHIFFKYQK